MKIKKWSEMGTFGKCVTGVFTVASAGSLGVAAVFAAPAFAILAGVTAAAGWCESESDGDGAPHDMMKRYPLHDGHDGPGFD